MVAELVRAFAVNRPKLFLNSEGVLGHSLCTLKNVSVVHTYLATKRYLRVDTSFFGKHMVAIGIVTKQSDGSYRGELKTLTIRSPIEIRPNPNKTSDRQPDYRVYAANEVEIGTGRKRTGQSSQTPYIALSLAIPEFGPKQLRANLGLAAGQNSADVFAIIWNPEPDGRLDR